MKKTGLYLDDNILKIFEEREGKGKVSAYIREVLKKLATEDYILVKVSSNTKKLITAFSTIPTIRETLEKTIDEAVDKSLQKNKEHLKRELDRFLD